MYTFKRMPLAVNRKRRVLVTSDIHGNLNHLEGVLKKASFSEDDLLVVIGDMLEKGPDSLGTLRYIMRLCEEGRAVATIGNVDYYRLLNIYQTVENRENARALFAYIKWIRDWKGTCFYDELLNEIGFKIEDEETTALGMQKIIKHFGDELDFLKSLSTVIETDKFVFVHGGLPCGDDELDNTPDSEKDAASYLKYDRFLSRAKDEGRSFKRLVICGHWPVINYTENDLCANPYLDRQTNILSIDGGCGLQKEGQLNLLVLPNIDCNTDEIDFVCYDGFPTVRVLEEQEGSDAHFSINWLDNDVKLIRCLDEFALIEHISSSRRIWVTRDSLWSTDNGGLKVNRCTDNMLDVKVGDELTVVQKTSRGILAKKNGVIGWYTGTYEE